MAGTAADVTAILTAVLAQVKKLTDEQILSLSAGTGEFKFVPKSLMRQFNQLTKLNDEQLQQLLEGEAEYKLVPKGYKVTKTPPPKAAPPNAAEIRSNLIAAPDQIAARRYLDDLKLKPADLKKIAAELDVPSKPTGPAITEALIKVFVTGRLTTTATRF